jgi:mannose-6-phosphate isomerase
MDALENVIQPYAWGSRTVLAELCGRPTPSPGPEAELWMGAHPSAPSRVVEDGRERSLLDLIALTPEQVLGSRVVSRFGPRLPFLLKVLAAETPLSLQAHPNLEQARAGYAAEEARGVPRDAPQRNYRDPNHKPELLCALGSFHALVGFRDVRASLRLFAELAVAPLAPFLGPLEAQADAAGLQGFFAAVMTAPAPLRATLAAATLAAALSAPHDAEFAREYRWAARLGELYPGDVGIVTALLLNLVELAPGEAVYLPAGNLHAYLQGTGVEIMASSDNVLRGGLTPKHVDLPELLRVLDFRHDEARPLRAELRGEEHVFATPAPEFRLSYFDVDGVVVPSRADGPEILLVTSGEVALHASGTELPLAHGRSALIRAADPSYELRGKGRVFRACPGLDPEVTP